MGDTSVLYMVWDSAEYSILRMVKRYGEQIYMLYIATLFMQSLNSIYLSIHAANTEQQTVLNARVRDVYSTIPNWGCKCLLYIKCYRKIGVSYSYSLATAQFSDIEIVWNLIFPIIWVGTYENIYRCTSHTTGTISRCLYMFKPNFC